MHPRSYDRLRLTLTVIGLAIAVYLTLLHYDSSVPLVCGRGSFVDCESVLSSPSSVVLGFPVAVWGLLWFVVALVLALLSARAGGEPSPLHAAALGWALVGTGTVLWLVYQEIGVIGKICAWCTAIHVLVLALLVVEVRAHGARPAS
jgi:uncharacterized membrane protein